MREAYSFRGSLPDIRVGLKTSSSKVNDSQAHSPPHSASAFVTNPTSVKTTVRLIALIVRYSYNLFFASYIPRDLYPRLAILAVIMRKGRDEVGGIQHASLRRCLRAQQGRSTSWRPRQPSLPSWRHAPLRHRKGVLSRQVRI